jgi:PAS domain S-box-containing protein
LIPASIRTRIIWLLLALALPLVAIVAIALEREYRTSAERAEGAAAELAVATANGVAQILEGSLVAVDALSRDPAILALDAPACAPWLREATAMLPQFANIVVADRAGVVVCSAVPLAPERPDVADRDWFRRALASGGPAIGRFQTGAITSRRIVVVAQQLRREDAGVIGVVAAGIAIEHFQRLLEGLPQPPGAVVTLADDAWTVLARSTDPERWIGQTLPGDTVPERAVAPGVGLFRATGLDRIDRVFGFATVDGPRWRVYAGVPESWIYAPVREAALRRGIAVATVLAAVAVLAVLLFRRITGSISSLVDGTRAAAQGQGSRVPEVGPTEVVEVARQFNATLAARERAEEDVRRAQERYASVLRNAPYGIFVATETGRFIDVNPALVRMLGYPSEAALHATSAHAAFADPDAFDEICRRMAKGERPAGADIAWRRADGERVLVRLSCGNAVTADGKQIIEVIAEDVTERRALEEHLLETRKMEAIARLAGGVAHDFNNLLTIVRGQAQFLQLELATNGAVQEHAAEIVNATERGARLTRQLLAFGRRQLVQPVPLDMNLTVSSLQSMLRHVVGEDVRIDMRLEDGLPFASADPGQLEQIVLNLVFNARDAMEDGGVVTIETTAVTLTEEQCRGRPNARPGDYVRLTVRDTGAGIPPELLDRVFEPFFTTKPHGRGTGLGLATVYGIVTQIGGWIDVDSTPGDGATFAVYLPVALGEPFPAEPASDSVEGDGQGTILVVEDEEAVRKVVVTALRQRGYEVLEAASGAEALSVAAAYDGTLDLLVTDEMMPGLRGTQLAAELVPRRDGLRVLFMSGYTDRVPAGTRFAGAPSTFLAKPFSHEQLLHAVAVLLKREPALDD